ncbi:MAG: GntR family transcriptional regulator [Rhizobiaceae bacterium]
MKRLNSVHDKSRIPLYAQVALVMRQRIETGHWAQGEKISTLEALEQEFSVARVTIRQAIDMLRSEGLLEAQQGRGTFVLNAPKRNRWLNLASDFDAMLASIRKNVPRQVHVENKAQAPELAEGEGELAEGYTFLRSVQYNEDEPFSVVNLHLARHIFDKDRKRFKKQAAFAAIAEMEDVTVAHAYQTLTIGVADPETAHLLKIGLGEPTADCRLVLVDDKGVAIYVANIHYRRDCFAMRLDLLDKSSPRKAN